MQTPFFRPVPTRRQSGRSHVRLVYSSRPAGLPPGILSKRRTAAGRSYTETVIARFDCPERFGPSFPNPTLRHPRAHMRIARPAEAEMVIRKSDDTDFSGTSLSCGCDKNAFFSFARFSDAPIRDKNVARRVFCRRGTKHKKTATDPCYDRTAPQSSVVTARIRERPCLARACIRRSKERKASCPSE